MIPVDLLTIEQYEQQALANKQRISKASVSLASISELLADKALKGKAFNVTAKALLNGKSDFLHWNDVKAIQKHATENGYEFAPVQKGAMPNNFTAFKMRIA